MCAVCGLCFYCTYPLHAVYAVHYHKKSQRIDVFMDFANMHYKHEVCIYIVDFLCCRFLGV